MPSGYKVNHIIVCDLVRREISGKDIAVGIYYDFIPVASFPASMPTICFRISVRLERDDFNVFNFLVKRPDGMNLMYTQRPLQSQTTNDQTIVNMQFVNPVFPQPGRYSICFGLDEAPQEIGFITLRQQEGAAAPEPTQR